MKLLLLLGLLSISCTAAPLFVTKCGLRYMGNRFTGEEMPGYTHTRIQAVEDASIARGLVTCKQLSGYNFYVRPEKAWKEMADGFERSGSTYCNDLEPRVEVGSDWEHTSAPHEFHHVSQRCFYHPIGPGDDYQLGFHWRWYEDGVEKAIDQVKVDLEGVQ